MLRDCLIFFLSLTFRIFLELLAEPGHRQPVTKRKEDSNQGPFCIKEEGAKLDSLLVHVSSFSLFGWILRVHRLKLFSRSKYFLFTSRVLFQDSSTKENKKEKKEKRKGRKRRKRVKQTKLMKILRLMRMRRKVKRKVQLKTCLSKKVRRL